MVEENDKPLDIGFFSSIMTDQAGFRRVSADAGDSLMPIDWAKAAWLSASGVRPAAIAEAVGCSRSQLHRRLRGCRLFGALVEQYTLALGVVDEPGRRGQPQESGAPAQLPLVEAVRAKLEQEIVDGNVRVAMWLAERLRLFSPEDKGGTDATLLRLLETMSEAERQAFSRPD
jgi:hypothetical protein